MSKKVLNNNKAQYVNISAKIDNGSISIEEGSSKESRNKTKLLKKFGKNLRTIRLKKNISQSDLAIFTGIHRSTISNYELGKRNPDIVNLFKLAGMLKCQVGELVVGLGKSRKKG
jgi:DNA-binding XRE family transcriptional regulator